MELTARSWTEKIRTLSSYAIHRQSDVCAHCGHLSTAAFADNSRRAAPWNSDFPQPPARRRATANARPTPQVLQHIEPSWVAQKCHPGVAEFRPTRD